MRDGEIPERELWIVLALGGGPKDPEREDSRKAKVDALCDRLECQMMGIRYE